MVDPSPDPNPFAFDDRTEEQSRAGRSRVSGRWMRASIGVTALSFVVALIGSFMENNVTGDRQLESIAYALNRYGMLFMLIGCVGIFIAFRASKWVEYYHAKGNAARRWSLWATLAFRTAIVIPLAILLLMTLSAVTDGIGIFVVVTLFPVLLSLVLVMAIWHQGVVRAYWIGVIGSYVIQGQMGGAGTWMSLYYSAYGGSGSWSNYPMDGYFGGALVFYILIGTTISLVLAGVSGLVCAGYVAARQSSLRSRIETMPSESEPAGRCQELPAMPTIDRLPRVTPGNEEAQFQ